MFIKVLRYYAYICIDNFILFFSGEGDDGTSKEVHKYSMVENKWMRYEQTLPILMRPCVAVLSESKEFIHILGVSTEDEASVHMKTEMKRWLKKEQQLMVEDKEQIDIEEIKIDMEEMGQKLNIEKLKIITTYHKKKKKKKEIETVIEHWIRLSLLHRLGWIDIFYMIILRYILPKYFGLIKVFHGHSDCVKSVNFSPDGTKFISSSDDKTIKIWDIESGNVIQELKGHLDSVNDAQFSPDGNMIISCSCDSTIRLWDAKTGIEKKRLEGHTYSVVKAQLSPDGCTVVSGSDLTIKIWDTRSGQNLQTTEKHLDGINDIQISPDGQKIASADDYSISLWNMAGERLRILEVDIGYIKKVQFSSDSSSVLAGTTDGAIRIWDVVSGRQVKKLGGYFDRFNYVKYFPDETMIVSCSSDNTIRLWDVKFGVEIQKLEGHSDIVTAVDISLDGDVIVSSSNDKTIRLWRRL
ncbi:hypothetical protein RFI_23522 [Reticulomyxa filosa]|uniref:Uncharacterized protein n=1 Tax=Reticulomyxa filosa TaxID=46433 RepID=X6MLA0_RETFI|nr:hypothetical protein RFI_23522 [Reticulomyxa filosa]|eukprot:ETO13845.1 hypothetical protein RFI_23522 [Reticulomyxa filosa]